MSAACLAVFAGIAWARIHWLTGAEWTLTMAAAALVSLRRRKLVALLLIAICCFSVGWWRGTALARQLTPYASLAQQQVVLTGQATADGAYGARYQTTFSIAHVQLLSPFSERLPGTVTVAGFGAPLIYSGDSVQVSGKLRPPFGGQQGSISFGQIRLLQRHTSWIDSLRHRFAAGLESALPEPQASFGLGLLIGQRNILPADVSQTLLAVGLTHLIAVSGYNLTIIIDTVRRLCAQRSKFQVAAASVLLILFFLALTGSSPSIVRAAIISLLGLAGWYYGREIKPLVLLLVAGAATALANPLYLWGNVSWYLSFLAFFGVVIVAPLVTRRLFGTHRPRLLPSIIIQTLCAEVMTLPYVLYVFGQISLIGLLANVLVVALVPLAMLLCSIAGLSGMLLPLAAGWLAWPAKELLTYMLDVSALLSRIPHSFIQHLSLGLGLLLAFYGMVLLIVFILRHKNAIITERIEGVGT